MTTEPPLSARRALIVGLGGLGCPAALALARAGIGELVLCDDDQVDASNLHRQILYRSADVGRDKLEAARERLQHESQSRITLYHSRLLPDNARRLVRDVDIVLEGADNFATKFLAADACYLEKVPVVHGAAVRFTGTAWSVGPKGGPCYRCLFEDVLPDAAAPNCSEAGVFGPVVGVIGSMMADLALDSLQSNNSRTGRIFTFAAKKLEMREVGVAPRSGCPLCDETAPTRITELDYALYTPTTCVTTQLGSQPKTSAGHPPQERI